MPTPTKDELTKKVMQNKSMVSAGMAVFGVLAAVSFAKRKRARDRQPR